MSAINHKIIVNPIAGRGAGAKAIPQIKELCHEAQIDYELVITEKPWHASELALQAANAEFPVVVAVGGDGTVNEVLNGLMQARLKRTNVPAMGVLCVGRGNDFAFGMDIPKVLKDGIQGLKRDYRKEIDVGYVTGGMYPQGRYFGNGVGIGFDAVVGFEALKLAPLSGFVSYIIAALKTIFRYFHAPTYRIELQNEILQQASLMVSVMNGRRMGGGFMMAPKALTRDGFFDVCIVEQVSRSGILALIPRFMQGTQEGHPAVKFFRSEAITITAIEGSLPAHADGETLCTEGEKLTIKIMPQALEVVCNPSQENP